jgi:hypothetical protein
LVPGNKCCVSRKLTKFKQVDSPTDAVVRTGLTFWHRSFTLIQINHQLDATIIQFIILTFVYSSTCFGRFPAHCQELNDCSGSLWFYLRIVVTVMLCLWSGRPVKVKPEAATAVIELLMMGGKKPETC